MFELSRGVPELRGVGLRPPGRAGCRGTAVQVRRDAAVGTPPACTMGLTSSASKVKSSARRTRSAKRLRGTGDTHGGGRGGDEVWNRAVFPTARYRTPLTGGRPGHTYSRAVSTCLSSISFHRKTQTGVQGIAELKRHRIDRFVLYPGRWTACSASGKLPTLNWTRVKFDAAGVKTLPDDKQGVYSFFAEPEIADHQAVRYLLYVGETHAQDFRTRVRSYLNEKAKLKPRVHVVEMLERFPSHLWLYYSVVDKKKVEMVEANCLPPSCLRSTGSFLPPCQTPSEGYSRDQESEVCVAPPARPSVQTRGSRIPRCVFSIPRGG